jgi:pimeloyl-ACP methyl ester carboxylesterase
LLAIVSFSFAFILKYIKDIIQVIEYQNLYDVVLVGHSYGGLVIGGALDGIAGRIKSMIFMDAYIPQDGKNAFDIVPGLRDIYDQRSLKEECKGWLVESYSAEEFSVTDPHDVDWMKSRLCPMPYHTHNEPLAINGNKFNRVPKTYIAFTDFGHYMFKSIDSKEGTNWSYHEMVGAMMRWLAPQGNCPEYC